ALAAGALMLAGGAWWAWQQYSQPPLGAPVDEPVPQVLAPVAPVAAPPMVAAPVVAPVTVVADPPVEEVIESPSLLAPPASAASAPAAAAVAVAAPRVPQPLPSGQVRLAVSPWGRVYVGRQSMGVTPPLAQFSLPQGRHTITVRNGDFP